MRAPGLVLLLAACVSEAPAADPPAVDAGPSNVSRADYVGPAACGECHDDKLAGWRRGLHASMNQLAAPASVLGDFATTLDYGGGTVRFQTDGGFTMAFAGKTYRVTRTIGSRYLQEYVGRSLDGGGEEIRLPFAWWKRPGGWFPRPYFDSWYGPEYVDGQLAVDPFQADAEPWAARCIWCHNTYPFELRALRTLVDPPVGQGLEQFYTLTRSRRSLAEQVDIAVFNQLPADELVTVGIGCESCHLGGREHAAGGDISFLPQSDDLRLRADAPSLAGGRKDPRVVTTICASCHSTPSDRFADRGATRNSSEALSMASGACVSQIKCTTCHDPHDAPQKVSPAACTASCHTWLQPARAQREHARHQDATCFDCHMPMVTQGPSGMSRSHRISLPAGPDMLAAAQPNACNLCHLDRSLAWTLAELARGWGKTIAPGPAWIHTYGALDAPLGPIWLGAAHASTRLAAAAAYGRQGQVRPLLDLLDAEVAYERMFVLFAVEDALGRRLTPGEYDPLAAPHRRAAQLRRLRAALLP